MPKNNKVLLVILDGWGLGEVPTADAVYMANTPFFDESMKKYPNTTLYTFGNQVGLPEGQMGNSEVGHLNIGAGRIVYQDLLKIDNAIEDGSFYQNPTLKAAMDYAKSNNKDVHLLGLVSDGGVHSQITHLKALSSTLDNNDVKSYIHAFTDGRDTDPNSGYNYLTDLKDFLKGLSSVKLSTVCGRYYAMDRDKRWERTKIAYDMLTQGIGTKTTDLLDGVKDSYDQGITDEFITPLVGTTEDETPIGLIKEGDVVLCFNFRTDRCRQITRALHQEDFAEQEMQKMDLHYLTMTQYDKNFENVNVLFANKNIEDTLGAVLEKNGKTQIRCAETEKYPHVTFFFSGGREEPYEGEERILVNSPKVATYDLQPEMSAPELTEKTIAFLKEKQPDFAVLNYANPDMVGHTGVLEAIIKAVETTDSLAKQLVETAKSLGYTTFVIADHGNADFVINDDGSPNTAHTTNMVPLIVVTDEDITLKQGKLGDLAPSILKVMGVDIPEAMTGEVIIN